MTTNAKDVIAKNIASMLHRGEFVNLGVGIPTLISRYIPRDMDIILHTENGAAGVDCRLSEAGVFDNATTFLEWENTHKGDETDYRTGHKDLIDAGGNPVTLIPGSSIFDVCTSFGMARGGHLDVTVLGAMEVDQKGNLANWMVPGQIVSGMGGAMDLLSGTKKVIVATTLLTKTGSPKLVKKCSLPLTAIQCVNTIVTEKCIIDIDNGVFLVKALYPGVQPDEIVSQIKGSVVFSETISEMIP